MYKNLPRFESQMTVDASRCCVFSFRMPSYYAKPSPATYELTTIIVRTTGEECFPKGSFLKRILNYIN